MQGTPLTASSIFSNFIKYFSSKISVLPKHHGMVVAVDFIPLGQEVEKLAQLQVGVKDCRIVVTLVECVAPAGFAFVHAHEGEDRVIAVEIAAIVEAYAK